MAAGQHEAPVALAAAEGSARSDGPCCLPRRQRRTGSRAGRWTAARRDRRRHRCAHGQCPRPAVSGEAASSHVSQHLARTALPSTTRLRHRWRHGGARLSQGRQCRPLGRWWPHRRPPSRLPRISSNQFLWPSAAGHSAYPAFRRVPETSRDARVLVSGGAAVSGRWLICWPRP